MSIAISVVQGLLAIAFAGAGTMKVASAREKLLANPQMGWANDFSATQIKLIGLAEILGAAGLVLPWITGVAPALIPVAAACLFVLMLGGAATHVRRKEPPVPAIVLGCLAALVAVVRFAALA